MDPQRQLRQHLHRAQRQEARAVHGLQQDVLRQGRPQDPLQRRAPQGDAQVHGGRLQHDVQLAPLPKPPLGQPQPQAAHAAEAQRAGGPRRRRQAHELLAQRHLHQFVAQHLPQHGGGAGSGGGPPVVGGRGSSEGGPGLLHGAGGPVPLRVAPGETDQDGESGGAHGPQQLRFRQRYR